MSTSRTEQPAFKDEEREHPVASAWRPAFQSIVKAFVEGDFGLLQSERHVQRISETAGNQIRDSIIDYGETLAELPDETWKSSVSQWMGTHWHVLVDLWTVESGRSDLVIDARVYEVEGSYRISVDSVYVP